MAYNLPPAWDPGFVLPDNVVDEGLERRALVTKWMPRGTYDQPKVGTGGYKVPEYVMDEGYGQGTFTTKWLPSGTYVGPKVPHWLNRRPQVVKSQRMPGGGKVVTVQPLGDTPMPPQFEAYGQKAAQMLLQRVGQLPPQQRAAALKRIMDIADPSLWRRTQDILRRYVGQGMSPASALPLALSRALSTGVAAELITTGQRRSAPQAASLLGLGCYGPSTGAMAMGDDSDAVKAIIARVQARAGVVPQTVSGGVKTASGIRVTVSGFDFDPYALNRAWAAASPASATVSNRNAPPDALITDPAQIPPAVVDYLRDQLVTPRGDATRSYCSTNAMTGFPEWDAGTWFGKLGIDCATPLNLHALWNLRTTVAPFARVTNAVDGSDMVLHISLAPLNQASPWDASANPLVLKAWLSHVPDPSVWTTIWKGVTYLPMQVSKAISTVAQPIAKPIAEAAIGAAQAVGDGVKHLADLTCELLSAPGVGAAAGVAAGMPPQAGQAGANIARSACGQPAPPAPMLPVVTRSILPLAILGGGAVLAIALLSRRKASHG